MAQRKRTNQRRQPPVRRRRKSGISIRSPFRRQAVEFKPDSVGAGWSTKFHITHVQRDTLLKWGSYVGLCLLLCMIQDVIMSGFHVSGATTDLTVCMILLISLYEGTENGSLFALIASILYHFSGSSPGPVCIGLITTLAMGINLIRQTLWQRSFGSILLCTAVAVMVYEMGVFIWGLGSGLTIFARAGVFLLTGGMSCITILPMYPLVRAISKIGGDAWKD